MNKCEFEKIESFMLSCMKDSAHDKEHVYRVLYTALDIAKTETVDYDILITACLLHDIGRPEETADATVNHAIVGSVKAYNWLEEQGYSETFAKTVKECIASHRYRKKEGGIPSTIEAKILYDADKLDTCGAMGIARTLLWLGRTDKLLYQLTDNCGIDFESNEITFIEEFNYKLKKLYGSFYTERANEIADNRKITAEDFYNNILNEIKSVYHSKENLEQVLDI